MDTMLPPMQEGVQPPIALPSKKLVLIATEGPHAGIYQLYGDIPADDIPKLEPFIPSVRFLDGRYSGASLIRVTDRAVYYRELIIPTSAKAQLAKGDGHGHFSPFQR